MARKSKKHMAKEKYKYPIQYKKRQQILKMDIIAVDPPTPPKKTTIKEVTEEELEKRRCSAYEYAI